MDGIFIIDDQSNSLVEKLVKEGHCKSIEYYDIKTDEDLDDFSKKIFKNRTVEKLIIPVSLGETDNNIGLRIGMHIRLSTEPQDDHLTPIIFVSDRSLETLLLDHDNKHAILATTDGTSICSIDINEITAHIAAIKPANGPNFYSSVLKNLVVRAPETTGPHSLANEWGVLQLNKVANVQALGGTPNVFKKRFSLFFKYLNRVNKSRFANHLFSATTQSATPSVIPSHGKKILYIDDEGYKGWVNVLKTIFQGSLFTELTDEHGLETDFFAKIKVEIAKDWDLILLDLRLKPLKEDLAGQVHPVADYSGAKILSQIKTTNPGVQVIIFTASNKAWNMRDLIDLGADGYYIKESPEYLIPDHLSFENYKSFKKQVDICFKNAHLRVLYQQKQNAINQRISNSSAFLAYSDLALNDSFKLLQLGLRESAYLMLFQAVEYYAEQTVYNHPIELIDQSGTSICIHNGSFYIMNFIQTPVKHYQIQMTSTNPKPKTALGKVSFVLAFKFGKTDPDLLHFGDLTQKRNDIAHGTPTTINDSELVDVIQMIQLFRSIH